MALEPGSAFEILTTHWHDLGGAGVTDSAHLVLLPLLPFLKSQCMLSCHSLGDCGLLPSLTVSVGDMAACLALYPDTWHSAVPSPGVFSFSETDLASGMLGGSHLSH